MAVLNSKKLYSTTLDYQKAHAGFDLVKIGSIAFLLLYHVSLVVPYHDNNIVFKLIAYVSRWGWLGTDFFFAMVGFLIFNRLSSPENSNLRTNLKYAVSRVLRVILPYYLFLLVYLHTGNWFFDYLGLGWAVGSGVELPLWTLTINWFLNSKITGVGMEGIFALATGVQMVLLAMIIATFVKNQKTTFWIYVSLELLTVTARIIYGNETDSRWEIIRIDPFLFGFLLAMMKQKLEANVNIRNVAMIMTLTALSALLTFEFLTRGISYWSHLTLYIGHPLIALLAASTVLWVSELNIKNRFRKPIWHLSKATYFVFFVKLPMAFFIVISLQKLNIQNHNLFLLLTIVSAITISFTLAMLWWLLVERKILHLFFVRTGQAGDSRQTSRRANTSESDADLSEKANDKLGNAGSQNNSNDRADSTKTGMLSFVRLTPVNHRLNQGLSLKPLMPDHCRNMNHHDSLQNRENQTVEISGNTTDIG
ncbi:putative acyltransferase [Gynuella sunshinyii YC6258]|uniref:Putative acyltransferase n=1 Tax=Gynuella sunshinyii YC6258 TaxID=1445510 RepID=A0A0C5VRA7_9GAMM|nr:acyltransferase [Gynuella sunshinyii]AJQ96771.1 putative acyltransferase [Gynuella sunshinyii YC6258]